MKAAIFFGVLVCLNLANARVGLSNNAESWQDVVEKIREKLAARDPLSVKDVSKNILGLFDVEVKSASASGFSKFVVNSHQNDGNNNVVSSVTIPSLVAAVDSASISSDVFKRNGNVETLDFTGTGVTITTSLSYTKSPFRVTKLSVDGVLESVSITLKGNVNDRVVDISSNDVAKVNAAIQARKERASEILLTLVNAVLEQLYPA